MITTSKKLTNEQISKISELIRIHLQTSELANYRDQLETALDSIEIFNELDTTNIPITSSSVGVVSVFRDDVVKKGLTQQQALQNAGQTYNKYIVVQRVIKN